jgi:hypothetical protein
MNHLLTAPFSPTTTGKIERLHRTLRHEFLSARVFWSVEAALRENIEISTTNDYYVEYSGSMNSFNSFEFNV